MLFDLIFILVCGFSYYMCYALWDDVLYALLYSNQTLYLIYIQIRYFLQTPLGLAALSWSIPKTYQLFIRSKLVQIRIRLVFSRVVSGSAFSPRPNPVFLEIRSESGVGAKNDPVAPPPPLVNTNRRFAQVYINSWALSKYQLLALLAP